MTGHNNIIFYDGVCGLCNRSVQFVIRHDHNKIFRFAALQSDFAKHILGENILSDSFIYYEDSQIFYRSTAALKVLKKFGGAWTLLYLLIIVPSFLRDGIYNLIARNRYKWFGKYERCLLPSPEQKDLFIA